FHIISPLAFRIVLFEYVPFIMDEIPQNSDLYEGRDASRSSGNTRHHREGHIDKANSNQTDHTPPFPLVDSIDTNEINYERCDAENKQKPITTTAQFAAKSQQ